MRDPRKTLACAAAMLVIAGCSTIEPTEPPQPESGSANFSVVAALGTSVTAGTESNGLVQHHQIHGFAKLFADLAGASRFDLPLISENGIPPLLHVVSYSPLLIQPWPNQGAPLNIALATTYHNLGVPGAILPDVVLDTSRYSAPNTLYPVILRHRGDMLAQLKHQLPGGTPPTFVTFEFGANEVLGSATRGVDNFPSLISPAVWGQYLHLTLDALEDSLPGAKLALFNVPDVTTIPFFTTFPALALGPNRLPVTPYVPLLGDRHVAGDSTLRPGQDLVLLTAIPLMAAGYGYPVGTTSYLSGGPVPGKGVALPNSVVLSADEVTTLRQAVNGYNSAYATEAAARGAALVDFNGLLRTASTTGIEVQGTTYTSAFLTGGLFSLDGIHPNDLAHAIMCNALVDAVNAKFGAKISHANLAAAATYRADLALPPRWEGPVVPAGGDFRPLIESMFPWRGAPAP